MKMKPTAKYSQVLFLLLLSFLLMQEVAECRTVYGGFESQPKASSLSRKILEGLGRDASRFGMVAGAKQEGLESWELRKVPSGPDPLHHHGGPTPHKP